MKPNPEEQPLEPNDPLWETLGRARPLPAPDPWFTAKVMRHLPPQDSDAPAAAGWLSWLTLSTPKVWMPVAAALVLALVALQALLPTPAAPLAEAALPGEAAPGELAVATPPPVLSDDPQVDAVLEDLDALLAFEDTTVSLEEPM